MKTISLIAGCKGIKTSFGLELFDKLIHFLMEVMIGLFEGGEVWIILDDLKCCFLHNNDINAS